MNKQTLIKISVNLGLILTTISPVLAQSVNEKPPQPFQSNEQDSLYREGFNPMDLIHNSRFLNGRSSGDFATDTDENLDKAAQDFKKQQLERMQQQNNPNSLQK